SKICLEKSGNQKTLVCPYHQWAFTLDGELMNSRQMMDDFVKSEYSLRKVHVEVMEDLIFINLSENPPSFDCMLKDVLPQLKPVGMTRVKVAYTKTYDVAANWKLIIENFRECYHCNVGHPEYIRAVEGIHKNDPDHVSAMAERWKSLGFDAPPVQFTSESWHHCQRYPFHQGFVTESLDGQPVAPLMGDYTEADMGTFCVVAYPNFWFESSSDHAITMQHTPVSPTLTRLTMTWFVDENAVEGKDYTVENVIAFWKITGEQDWVLCSNNQAGVNSVAYRPGPYGKAEVEIKKFQDWYLNNMENAQEVTC
ncbi:MAG: Rieske (2Fe-2S) protein, partial [Chitinophagaceae bacterium]|nr:Rieske (2Fe-2S) protein [Chitinophagaceae bacterium]